MLNPTRNQIDQAAVSYEEFKSLIERLVKEGFDYRSLLAGASSALAESIDATAGADKAAEWFKVQSDLIEQIMGPTN